MRGLIFSVLVIMLFAVFLVIAAYCTRPPDKSEHSKKME